MGNDITIPSLIEENIDKFACPSCKRDIAVNADGLRCLSCGMEYGSNDGIPLLFLPNEWENAKQDSTETVKAFYSDNPFPNYDEIDTAANLIERAQRGIFARLLNEQVPVGSIILEAGCGTGQLSNYLGLLSDRTVFGTDICLNSLKLGQRFRRKNQIDRVAFIQMNLFRPVFKPETFDLVISNGVLHHTNDPFLGYRTLSGLVKKGGHIIIGLYNKYARIPTDLRRVIFNASRDRFRFIDRRLTDGKASELRRRIWFMDQYKNPVESKHTFDETLGWFDRTGFEFVKSIPKPVPFDNFAPDEWLFNPVGRGSKIGRVLVQLDMLIKGGKDGALFIMIGRKKRD